MIFYDRHKSEPNKDLIMSESHSEKTFETHHANDTFVEYKNDEDSFEDKNDFMPYDDDAAESRIIDDFEEGIKEVYKCDAGVET